MAGYSLFFVILSKITPSEPREFYGDRAFWGYFFGLDIIGALIPECARAPFVPKKNRIIGTAEPIAVVIGLSKLVMPTCR
jgi:hypothetical protein